MSGLQSSPRCHRRRCPDLQLLQSGCLLDHTVGTGRGDCLVCHRFRSAAVLRRQRSGSSLVTTVYRTKPPPPMTVKSRVVSAQALPSRRQVTLTDQPVAAYQARPRLRTKPRVRFSAHFRRRPGIAHIRLPINLQHSLLNACLLDYRGDVHESRHVRAFF